MNIEVDGVVYNIPEHLVDELVSNVWPHLMSEWAKVPQSYRLAAKPVARAILYDMEKKTREKSGNEKAIEICRPQPGKDPVEHFLWILLGVFGQGLKNASATVTSEGESHTVKSLTIGFTRARQGDERRQMASHGNIGEREDDGGQDA